MGNFTLTVYYNGNIVLIHYGRNMAFMPQTNMYINYVRRR